MERLTTCVGYQNNKPVYKTNIDMRKLGATDKLKNALGKYEDAEEQGLLLQLKAKPNDTVYTFIMGIVKPMKILRISTYIIDEKIIIDYQCQNDDNFRNFTNDEFGKFVFLTENEAEKALKSFK